MGRILDDGIHGCHHGSYMGRTRPNRRVDISPFRWALQMKNKDTQQLAVSVYILAMRKQIEAKYLRRIEYLVGANNELMKELEQQQPQELTKDIRLAVLSDELETWQKRVGDNPDSIPYLGYIRDTLKGRIYEVEKEEINGN